MAQTKAQLIDGKGAVDLGALSISGSAPDNSVNLDASGRFLVGTSTARAMLGITPGIQSEGTSFAQGNLSLTVNSTAGNQYPILSFARSGGTTLGSNTIVSNGDIIGKIFFVAADGVDMDSSIATIEAVVDGTPGANDLPGRLVFSTTADGASSPTERMRISQNGQVQVSNALNPLLLLSTSTAGTTNYLLAGNNSVTTSVYIWTNGNIQNTNGSYTAISDAKLKENIVDAKSQWNDLKAIKIRNWNYKEETGYETHRQIGPIAQELEAVCPGLVFETPDRDEDGNETGEVTKGVNQSVLYMKAVKALQEAMERIEQLEAKVAAFESA